MILVQPILQRPIMGSKIILLLSMLLLVTAAFAQRGRGTILAQSPIPQRCSSPRCGCHHHQHGNKRHDYCDLQCRGQLYCTEPSSVATRCRFQEGFKKALRKPHPRRDQRAEVMRCRRWRSASAETIEATAEHHWLDTTTATPESNRDRRVRTSVNGRNALSLVSLPRRSVWRRTYSLGFKRTCID